MPAEIRIVLAAAARFAAVDEHLRRCGLVLADKTPQVFPARPEPRDAWWTDPDGEVAAHFRYHVNPDRRVLTLGGNLRADIATTVRLALGEISFDEMERRLMRADDDPARIAAFLIAASGAERAVAVLCEGLAARNDYVGTGCVQALELVGEPSVVPLLLEIRRDPTRAGDLRLLAGEVAAALRPALA